MYKLVEGQLYLSCSLSLMHGLCMVLNLQAPMDKLIDTAVGLEGRIHPPCTV
jgi:hypothetical protein